MRLRSDQQSLGPSLEPDGCSFLVWAPNAAEMQLRVVEPKERTIPMDRCGGGYYHVFVDGLGAGARYFFEVNGKSEFPDPASRFQPEGVHGPSEVIDRSFEWTDSEWFGIPLRNYIIYELHIGTFTEQGTFDSAITELPRLRELGITAIEIMPVAQFPGVRNWGYDGVGLFAVQNSYGGPEGLKRLVNAAHREGIAVILDVVYNHLGPEGNYLSHFGPYFTDTYRTPWGDAINFDGAHSDGVRRFFIENALYWQMEFHIDALRLDAIHAIRDNSAVPFLRQLSGSARLRSEELNRRFYLIGESDLNAPRFILPEKSGGYGLDAQWADDFHHCLHVLLTGERRGYYEDYRGGLGQFAKVWREGYAYTGEFSEHRKAFHGDTARQNSLKQFVVCAQNHDQIGNRMHGDRLATLVDFDSLKLAAGTVLLSPFIPLLFMGDEYGERAPFQYFVDHSDEPLLEAVRTGRREEFASFVWSGEVPDPGAARTFERCRLNPQMADSGQQQLLLEFYRKLIRLRIDNPAIMHAERHEMTVRPFEEAKCLLVHYHSSGLPELVLFLCFGDQAAEIQVELTARPWKLMLDSTGSEWGGGGPHFPETLRSGPLEIPRRAVAVFRRETSNSIDRQQKIE